MWISFNATMRAQSRRLYRLTRPIRAGTFGTRILRHVMIPKDRAASVKSTLVCTNKYCSRAPTSFTVHACVRLSNTRVYDLARCVGNMIIKPA